MSSQFKIIFHRYSSREGSRISNEHFMSAENFRAAFENAERMAWAMNNAAPEFDHVVMSVEAHGYRGTKCNGSLLFETAEEFSARVKEGKQ